MKKGVDYTGIVVSHFVHDGNGQYLFGRRGPGCRDEVGVWENGGGGLKFCETIEETLKRELMEEYCVSPKKVEFLGYRDALREIDGQKTHWVGFDFKVEVDRDLVKIGEPEKMDEILWSDIAEYPKPMHSQVEFCIEKYKDKL